MKGYLLRWTKSFPRSHIYTNMRSSKIKIARSSERNIHISVPGCVTVSGWAWQAIFQHNQRILYPDTNAALTACFSVHVLVKVNNIKRTSAVHANGIDIWVMGKPHALKSKSLWKMMGCYALYTLFLRSITVDILALSMEEIHILVANLLHYFYEVGKC